MSHQVAAAATPTHPLVERALAERDRANRDFFGAEAGRLARICHHMAVRFSRGGRLIACGIGGAAASDARHIAVEFVHPVIVGKRALPALAITGEFGAVTDRVRLLVDPADIVVVFGQAGDDDADSSGGTLEPVLRVAREGGALTIGFGGSGADEPLCPATADPYIRQELIETAYHVLWELVHVFFEHRGLLSGRASDAADDGGAAAFLYPFLAERENDLEGVLADVSASVLMKASEIAQLRLATARGSAAAIIAAAATLRSALDNGGTVLAFGNGGSATDAMDFVADLVQPIHGWPARRALDLTADPSILSAISNDVGTEPVFARQIIAYGRPGDAAVAFSTSGDSRNVIVALTEARSRGIATVAFVGYHGGRIAQESLADHIILAPSQNIPRIQEAHATAYHLLRALIETDDIRSRA